MTHIKHEVATESVVCSFYLYWSTSAPMKMFEGLLNIARSMTKNITCSVQDASVLQGFDAELVDMTLEAAKAIADKPRPSPSPEAPGLPVRSDHILIDILIHLTQNVAEPRIIVFEHI